MHFCAMITTRDTDTHECFTCQGSLFLSTLNWIIKQFTLFQYKVRLCACVYVSDGVFVASRRVLYR